MKVLMLVIDKQRIQLESLYEGIAKCCDLDLRRLSSKDQNDLSGYFKKNIHVNSYERIILFLRFKKEIRQVAFIRSLVNLVILEHDASQNYSPLSKYMGKFSRHYESMPWARVIVSSETLKDKLKAEGFDVRFVPKGYDQNLLCNLNLERDIGFGFIGNTEHATYEKRKTFLEQARDLFGLSIIKTKSGEDYLKMLNRISFFLSADIGFDEYMVKNFEAMACGCVLFTYDQGAKENSALGFRDMHNVVLYNDMETLKEKLSLLGENEELANKIAKSGQLLAETRFTFESAGKQIVDAIKPKLREKESVSILDYIRYSFRR